MTRGDNLVDEPSRKGLGEGEIIDGKKNKGDENLLVEPFVGHDEKALVTDGITPAVLYFESNGFLRLLVYMNCSDDHRMGHGRLRGLETLGFGEACHQVSPHRHRRS